MFNIGAVYTFYPLAPAILGAEYKNMTVKAVLGAAEAIKYSDIVTLHETLTPVVAGLPASVNDCTYILFEKTDGTPFLIANEYINQTNIIEVRAINLRVELFEIENSDIAVIRARLLELGYTNFTLRTF